jgi:hypothetical protein
MFYVVLTVRYLQDQILHGEARVYHAVIEQVPTLEYLIPGVCGACGHVLSW